MVYKPVLSETFLIRPTQQSTHDPPISKPLEETPHAPSEPLWGAEFGDRNGS